MSNNPSISSGMVDIQSDSVSLNSLPSSSSSDIHNDYIFEHSNNDLCSTNEFTSARSDSRKRDLTENLRSKLDDAENTAKKTLSIREEIEQTAEQQKLIEHEEIEEVRQIIQM